MVTFGAIQTRRQSSSDYPVKPITNCLEKLSRRFEDASGIGFVPKQN